MKLQTLCLRPFIHISVIRFTFALLHMIQLPPAYFISSISCDLNISCLLALLNCESQLRAVILKRYRGIQLLVARWIAQLCDSTSVIDSPTKNMLLSLKHILGEFHSTVDAPDTVEPNTLRKSSEPLNEQQAAILIQSYWRGYNVRRLLRNANRAIAQFQVLSQCPIGASKVLVFFLFYSFCIVCQVACVFHDALFRIPQNGAVREKCIGATMRNQRDDSITEQHIVEPQKLSSVISEFHSVVIVDKTIGSLKLLLPALLRPGHINQSVRSGPY